jgi:hypothetical protein
MVGGGTSAGAESKKPHWGVHREEMSSALAHYQPLRLKLENKHSGATLSGRTVDARTPNSFFN